MKKQGIVATAFSPDFTEHVKRVNHALAMDLNLKTVDFISVAVYRLCERGNEDDRIIASDLAKHFFDCLPSEVPVNLADLEDSET